MNTTTATKLTREDTDRLALLGTDAAVADFTDIVASRLDAAVVDRETYIANWRDALELDETKIIDARNADELQEDQARFAIQRIVGKREVLDILERASGATTMADDLEKTAGAEPDMAAVNYLEEKLCEYLPGFEVAGGETTVLWIHARIAIDNEKDGDATTREVADRVAATWLTLYGMAD
jgi:hypothetical protein